MSRVFLIAFIAVSVLLPPLAAKAQDFVQWRYALMQDAMRHGVSREAAAAGLGAVQPDPRVIKLDRRQPEKTASFAGYRKFVVSAARIQAGRRMMRENARLLDAVGKRYGVPPQFIVALWGIETSYGKNTGNYDTIRSLATLAWEGRRADFFRTELFDALKIIDQGGIAFDDMKGSWAGAMGQNQFMPSSFLKFAVDGDGDGRRDIWNTRADVFASTANYLAKSGWKTGERWGRAVHVPHGFSPSHVTLKSTKTLAEWKRLGVTLPGGKPLPVAAGMRASLVAPDGLHGPTYLAYDNYRAIMLWNRSTYFATSVGLLADAIAED
jgi:membrane-bound lytic murein transglycosylase B